jgi:N-methylhydantoinase A
MTASRQLRVGVDIGGTFTDLVFVRPDGKLDKRKLPSTPADYAQAILDGVSAFSREHDIPPREVSEIVHATTIATNAILERKGARTALVTTEGFRDVLELRRIRIPLSYDLGWQKPEPLVPRRLRYTVPERLDAQGNVLTELDETALARTASAIAADGVDAIAVCFLHSYRNPAHENAAGEMLRRHLPHAHVSLSCEVLPEMLEFERTSTTVVNAYVAPIIGRYLKNLRASFHEREVRAPILVMQSNGGLVSAHAAAERPVTIIESGPAAGVVAAARLARDSGYHNVITLDMGGTTTKASIIEAGEMLRANEYEVGSPVSVSSRLMRGNGYVLRTPVIDISEVGAGGGSIAAVDPGGALRVGPHSAGAIPGPACYGRGNTRPTVTDANLVLGYIHHESLAGGSLHVDKRLAEGAVQSDVAGPSQLTLEDAAYGIHLIANSNMVRAIKSVSVERGRDPADFALMAFGGAGPIHAAGIARELGIRVVLIPPSPGVFSAFGLLRAEVEHHAARTVLTDVRTADCGAIQAAFDAMRSDLLARARAEGYDAGAVSSQAYVDVRYRNQSSEITVPFDAARVSASALDAAVEAFEREFERTYGHRGQTKDFELVNCRLIMTIARGVEHGGQWMLEKSAAGSRATRRIYFGPQHGWMDTRTSERSALAAEPVTGPAIIEEYDTSVVVPPGCSASLDTYGNIVMQVGDR